jgi:uncharacterized protein YcfJ
MVKSLVFVALAAGAISAGPALAQGGGYVDERGADNVRLAWADVLRVDPVYENVESTRPREECYDTDVERRDSRGNNGAGTVIGAIVGGALGNQVGKGDGRKAATIAGAVAGGAIGHNIEKDQRGSRTYYRILVRMDHGRTSWYEQPDSYRLRRGDRVYIDNGYVVPAR